AARIGFQHRCGAEGEQREPQARHRTDEAEPGNQQHLLPALHCLVPKAESTADWVSTVGSTMPSCWPWNTTYSGTPTAPCASRKEVMAGSTLVQSPTRYCASAASSAARKASVASTRFSFALQVTHQSAVMFTNTVLPAARNSSRR